MAPPPWDYITHIMGPGLIWSRTRCDFERFIARAEADGQHEAAEHLRIMARLRGQVMLEPEEKDPGARPG
jgi:hypothetical protein